MRLVEQPQVDIRALSDEAMRDQLGPNMDLSRSATHRTRLNLTQLGSLDIEDEPQVQPGQSPRLWGGLSPVVHC